MSKEINELNNKNHRKNISKISPFSAKYNKPKIRKKYLDIKEKNTRNILQNAGKDLINSTSENYISMEMPIYNSSISYSIISPQHRGIKRKGYDLYDPYLIQVCKSAIYREKKELPNYKDIIKRVNTEFGIENENYNDIDLYYKKLIEQKNKNLENYIKSIKPVKRVPRKFIPKKDTDKEKE